MSHHCEVYMNVHIPILRQVNTVLYSTYVCSTVMVHPACSSPVSWPAGALQISCGFQVVVFGCQPGFTTTYKEVNSDCVHFST